MIDNIKNFSLNLSYCNTIIQTALFNYMYIYVQKDARAHLTCATDANNVYNNI